MRNVLLSCALCIVVIILALLSVYVAAPKRNLDRILVLVSGIQLNKTNTSELRRQADQNRIKGLEFHCEGETCNASWSGSNLMLHKFHLAPRTTAMVNVRFQHDVATDVDIVMEIDDMVINRANTPGTGATIHYGNGNCDPDYKAEVKQKGPYKWPTVSIGPCVLRENRFKVFAINTGCLMKLGGCKKGEDILPYSLPQH